LHYLDYQRVSRAVSSHTSHSVEFPKELAGLFAELGVHAAIGFIRNTLTGPWLDAEEIKKRLGRPFRLRLL
jgi:hypothetical protein